MNKKPWRDFVPPAPVIDFAYLKEIFGTEPRKLPHLRKGDMYRYQKRALAKLEREKKKD